VKTGTEGAGLFQVQCGPRGVNDKESPVCRRPYVGRHQVKLTKLTRVLGSIDHAQAEQNCENICEEKKR